MQRYANSFLIFIFATTLLWNVDTFADEPPASVSTDAIINLPVNGAWKLFTTPQGLGSMGYVQARIDLRMDGGFHVEQNNGAEKIDAKIASFEPEHMLSLKHENPSSAPAWSVLYFQAMGDEMTSIRWVDFASAAQAQNLTTGAQAHRTLFNQLIRRYAPECELCRKEREAREAKEGK